MDNSTTRFMIVVIFILTIVASSALTALVTKSTGGGVQTARLNEKEIMDVVYKAIKADPNRLIAAVSGATGKAPDAPAAADPAEKRALIESKKKGLTQDPGSPVIGNPKGDITVTEFFDYNCGYCKRAFPTLQKLIEKDKNVRVVLKDFPIFGARSLPPAQASVAVHLIAPDKFLKFHGEVLKRGASSEGQLLELAKELGIDDKALKEKMGSDEVKKQINKNRQLGEDLGVRGTPAFIIGGSFVPGAVGVDAMEKIVKKERKQNKKG